ncbi:MAG TPA: urea carboxylase [Pasteurellaceae bacterium]|nr:urea carboxylase [Pasteurellaceae bacterium]
MKSEHYSTTIAPASHWSLRVRRGSYLRLTDLQGGANVGMLFYNPENLLERYNAPDTLKCQHTFKLSKGNCLFSDMGRIFASIIQDDCGWHDTVCGNIYKEQVASRWGARNYQQDRNKWYQNGHDAFLVELIKYGLNIKDMVANVNWFSCVKADSNGHLSLIPAHSTAGDQVTLRFEMDTLVLLHTCPHPLNHANPYPAKPVKVELGIAEPMTDDDYCLNFCDENRRGFSNNFLYYLGSE